MRTSLDFSSFRSVMEAKPSRLEPLLPSPLKKATTSPAPTPSLPKAVNPPPAPLNPLRNPSLKPSPPTRFKRRPTRHPRMPPTLLLPSEHHLTSHTAPEVVVETPRRLLPRTEATSPSSSRARWQGSWRSRGAFR
jgi:hypothetical protein